MKSSVPYRHNRWNIVPKVLQNFNLLTYYVSTLVKHDIPVTKCASIYEEKLHTLGTKYWLQYAVVAVVRYKPNRWREVLHLTQYLRIFVAALPAD
jgi:hypothetical protein